MGDNMEVKYETMSTEHLENLLRQDLNGEINLETENILAISAILAVRDPLSRRAEEGWTSFCQHYLPEVTDHP